MIVLLLNTRRALIRVLDDASVDWSKHNGYVASGGGDNNIVVYSDHENLEGILSITSIKENAHLHADVNCVW